MLYNMHNAASGPAAVRSHMHVVVMEDDDARDHPVIQFREIMRKDEQLRKEYGELKLELSKKAGKNRAAYSSGKSKFIKRALLHRSSGSREFYFRYLALAACILAVIMSSSMFKEDADRCDFARVTGMLSRAEFLDKYYGKKPVLFSSRNGEQQRSDFMKLLMTKYGWAGGRQKRQRIGKPKQSTRRETAVHLDQEFPLRKLRSKIFHTTSSIRRWAKRYQS